LTSAGRPKRIPAILASIETGTAGQYTQWFGAMDVITNDEKEVI
jgi:hypothetical protein